MIKKLIPPTLLAVFFTIIYSLHSLYRHFTFNSHAFDLGIHTQVIYLYSQGLTPFSSLKHMTILADHFGPILFLISPIYRLFPSATTLLIFQAVAVAFSSIPIYFIARNKLKNIYLSLLVSLSYLAAPSILSAINFDFHLATISVLPLSLIIFSWYFKKWKLYILFLFFSILFKEDIFIFILGLGIYSLFTGYKKIGIFTIAFSLIVFYLIKFIIMPFFWAGAETGYLGSSILPFTDPVLLIYLLITNPKIFIDQIFNSPVKLNTIVFVYKQFAFLSILSPLSWLTVFPALFLRFSSTATHFWTNYWHYNANLTPFLTVSAIFAIGNFKLSKKAVTLLLIFFLIFGGLAPNTFIWNTLAFDTKILPGYSYIEDAIRLIPSSASVSAQSPIVSHLANREKIYLYPETLDAQYLILDTALDTYPVSNEQLIADISKFKSSKIWKIKYQIKKLIIFQRVD